MLNDEVKKFGAEETVSSNEAAVTVRGAYDFLKIYCSSQTSNHERKEQLSGVAKKIWDSIPG